jgi:hypothetical protein
VCDFSKSARDAFRTKTREFGLAEVYLWGKGEIEDMLFQPKNDHLLFVYFGISLQARRRTLKSDVRARLAMKRKAARILAGHRHQSVLIRDASDDRYPYLDEDKSKSRVKRGRWKVMQYAGSFHDGLHFAIRRHFAFLDDDGEHWDYAETMNDAEVAFREDPWHEGDDDGELEKRSPAMEIWQAFPKQNQAWFELLLVLPFENIVDIDENGDDYCGKPHIYTVEFREPLGPFREYTLRSLETTGTFSSRSARADEVKRVEKFPRSSVKETAK